MTRNPGDRPPRAHLLPAVLPELHLSPVKLQGLESSPPGVTHTLRNRPGQGRPNIGKSKSSKDRGSGDVTALGAYLSRRRRTNPFRQHRDLPIWCCALAIDKGGMVGGVNFAPRYQTRYGLEHKNKFGESERSLGTSLNFQQGERSRPHKIKRL